MGFMITESAEGNGPIDASFNAVKKISQEKVRLEEFLIQAITRGSDDLGKVHVQIVYKGNCLLWIWGKYRYRYCIC